METITEFLSGCYYEILAFHVIAFMSWMAMLFYLPRLFVYHVEHAESKDFGRIAGIQEEKLYRFIGLPAFWATLVSGIVLIFASPNSPMSHGWFHIKLLMLVLLIAYSFSLDYYRKQLLAGTCKRSGKFFRAYNEAPTWLSIIIIVCVVTMEVHWWFMLFITALFAFVCYKIMTLKKK
jgi:putative membrane protein